MYFYYFPKFSLIAMIQHRHPDQTNKSISKYSIVFIFVCSNGFISTLCI